MLHAQVRFFVLDEADRLVADNPDVIMSVFKRLPKVGACLDLIIGIALLM